MRLALSIAAVLLAASAGRAETLIVGEAVAEIPIVKTAAELTKGTVLDPEGCAVQVGIEAKECERGAGMLLYIHPTKPVSDIGGNRDTTEDDAFAEKIDAGPVVVEIKRQSSNGDRLIKERLKRAMLRRDFAQIAGEIYYACPVCFSSAGKYDVRVLSLAGDLLAVATVDVAGNISNPWSKLGCKDIDVKSTDPIAAKFLTGRELPRVDPMCPRPLPEGALPALVPGASPDFLIKEVGGNIQVTFGKKIANQLEERMLIRVWINGERPGKDELWKIMKEAHEALTELEPPVKFTLALDLKGLLIEPGDKVEVQLAYCPGGIREAEIGDRRRQLDRAMEQIAIADLPVLVSNKIVLGKGKPAGQKVR